MVKVSVNYIVRSASRNKDQTTKLQGRLDDQVQVTQVSPPPACRIPQLTLSMEVLAVLLQVPFLVNFNSNSSTAPTQHIILSLWTPQLFCLLSLFEKRQRAKGWFHITGSFRMTTNSSHTTLKLEEITCKQYYRVIIHKCTYTFSRIIYFLSFLLSPVSDLVIFMQSISRVMCF